MTAFFSYARLKPPGPNGRITSPDLRTAGAIVVLLAGATAPPPVLHQALAATAGTLFEAAPFVLAVGLVRGPLVRPLAALLGCGCGGAAGAAALSLPATALCWTIFGPWVALARFGAAAILRSLEHRFGRSPREPDLVEQLEGIGLSAFALALGTNLALVSGVRFPFAPCVTFVFTLAAGALAGALAPCATAAVALAGLLRTTAPSATAGILATAGLVPGFGRRAPAVAREQRSATFALTLVALACFGLALRGGSGLVHPRLVPLLWFAVLAAFVAARRMRLTRSRLGLAAPCIMLTALLAGSPPPTLATATSMLDDRYPGEPVAIAGRAWFVRDRTELVRYAITCCRADATAIVAPTDIAERFPDGTWLAIRGTIVRGSHGDVVRVAAWRRIATPADPYTYR